MIIPFLLFCTISCFAQESTPKAVLETVNVQTDSLTLGEYYARAAEKASETNDIIVLVDRAGCFVAAGTPDKEPPTIAVFVGKMDYILFDSVSYRLPLCFGPALYQEPSPSEAFYDRLRGVKHDPRDRFESLDINEFDRLHGEHINIFNFEWATNQDHVMQGRLYSSFGGL